MESTKKNLHRLITEKNERLSAYKRKNDHFVYESIHPADVENYEANGWEIHKVSKTRVRVKKLKSHDKLLEDQAWCLFYRMGYPEINDDQFKITFNRFDGSVGSKQIDVFAKDDETVMV